MQVFNEIELLKQYLDLYEDKLEPDEFEKYVKQG